MLHASEPLAGPPPPSRWLPASTFFSPCPYALRLHAWVAAPMGLPAAPRARVVAAGLRNRIVYEALWGAPRWPRMPEHVHVLLRDELLAGVGAVPLWLEPHALQPLAGLGANVRSLRLQHERWTSLAVRRSFASASVEVGLEGLSSEPMAAMERRGQSVRPLRRAGAVASIHLGARRSALSIWAVCPLRVEGAAWALRPAMSVHGHVRRWLGHGRRPHMDLRWKAEGALSAAHAASGVVAQLRGHAAWRQVVGERGQVVQVGSFPTADEGAGPMPHVLYEPLRGHEDFARYTAHVFSTEINGTVRLRPRLALGGFLAATQLDHPLQVRRNSWLCAGGPVASARLPFGPSGLTMRWQSARRTGAHDGARWLHLLTIGA